MEINMGNGFDYSVYELRKAPEIPNFSKDILNKIAL